MRSCQDLSPQMHSLPTLFFVFPFNYTNIQFTQMSRNHIARTSVWYWWDRMQSALPLKIKTNWIDEKNLPVYPLHYYANSSCTGSLVLSLWRQRTSEKTFFQSLHCHYTRPTPSHYPQVVWGYNCTYTYIYFHLRMLAPQNAPRPHLLWRK